MSDPSGRPALPPDPTTSPDQRNGCLTAFMILAGIILLLPGLCVILVSTMGLAIGSRPFATTSLLLGFAGAALIAWAILRKR